MATSTQPRRVGALEDYPRISSLDDPRLGLSHEALTNRLLDLPDGWSPEMARALAEQVHVVVSALIGEVSTHRGSLDPMIDVLVGACAAERFDERDGQRDSPFEEVLERAKELRADDGFGWGSGRAGLRRLPRLGEIPIGRGRTVVFVGPDDYATLDEVWREARRRMGRRATLPLEICSAFFPGEREGVVEGVGPFLAPSVWQMVAQWIVWGAEEVRLRVLEYLADEASRELGPRAGRPEGGRLAGSSVLNKASAARQLADRITERHDLFAHAAGWASRLARIDLEDIDAEIDGWRADRSAVPLVLYRRRRAELISRVEAKRRRDGTLGPGAFYALRDLVELSLCGETAARIHATAALLVADIDFSHHWPDSPYVGPAVRIRPGKKGRRARNVASRGRWKAISQTTARYLAEWLKMIRADERPSQTIWMSHWLYPLGVARIEENRMPGPSLSSASLSGRLSGSKSARSVPILPKLGGGAYSAHCLRHSGAQHALGVGVEMVRTDDRHAQRVSPQVFADALLDHSPRGDVLGYQDLLRNRDLWALRAAVGSRADGPGGQVPGVLDLLDGDAGARRDYDVVAIALAERALERARQELAAEEALLSERLLERRDAQRRPLPPRPSGEIDQARANVLLLERDIAREEREQLVFALNEQIDELHRRCAAARAKVRGAHARREQALTECNHVVSDAEPTTGELRQQAVLAWQAAGNAGVPAELDQVVGREDETAEQAVARAGLVLVDADEDEARATPTRVRHHLNMPEMAALLGLSDGGLRKLVNGGTKRAPFPLAGPESVLEQEGAKLRFFDIDRLPATFVARLLPEQRELLEQMLGVPMGSTPWGGRARRSAPAQTVTADQP